MNFSLVTLAGGRSTLRCIGGSSPPIFYALTYHAVCDGKQLAYLLIYIRFVPLMAMCYPEGKQDVVKINFNRNYVNFQTQRYCKNDG